MKTLNDTTALDRQLRLLGAYQMLEQIQRTLNTLAREFGPQLFPNGVPIVSRSQATVDMEQKAKAKKLVEGAEAMHKQRRGKKPRRSKHIGKQRAPRSAPDSPTIMLYEAAEILDMEVSGVRSAIKAGRLPSAGKNEKGIMVVRRSDVEAYRHRARCAKAHMQAVQDTLQLETGIGTEAGYGI